MREQQIFSKYMEIIPYENRIAVYNKINGALILLNPENIEKHSGYWKYNVEDEEIAEYLQNNLFFASDEYIQSLICDKSQIKEDYNDVILIVSTTEICNCSCLYCYQNNWDKVAAISDRDYEEWILAYITRIVELSSDDANIRIKYFGGEPLLRIDFIARLNHDIEALLKSTRKKISVRFFMDSNCVLLKREVFGLFENLTLATTLSFPEDHNSLRSNSFETVLTNLLDVATFFELPQYHLIIGYNAHHNNIQDFPRFLDFIKGLNIKCQFDVQNIVNYEAGKFINRLSDENFEKHYCETIIPALMNNGYSVTILPPYGIQRKCNGVNSINRKFFSNGTQVLCSYFDKTLLKSELDYPMPIMQNSYLDSLPEMCIKCYDFPYCGGMRPCIQCNGVYPFREKMRNRIITFLNLRNK